MHCTGCPHSLFEQRVRLACGTRTRNAVLHNCNPLRQQQRHTSRRVGRKAGIQERPTELPSVNQQLLQWLVANGSATIFFYILLLFLYLLHVPYCPDI